MLIGNAAAACVNLRINRARISKEDPIMAALMILCKQL